MSNKYLQQKADINAANELKLQKKKSLFDDLLLEPIVNNKLVKNNKPTQKNVVPSTSINKILNISPITNNKNNNNNSKTTTNATTKSSPTVAKTKTPTPTTTQPNKKESINNNNNNNIKNNNNNSNNNNNKNTKKEIEDKNNKTTSKPSATTTTENNNKKVNEKKIETTPPTPATNTTLKKIITTPPSATASVTTPTTLQKVINKRPLIENTEDDRPQKKIKSIVETTTTKTTTTTTTQINKASPPPPPSNTTTTTSTINNNNNKTINNTTSTTTSTTTIVNKTSIVQTPSQPQQPQIKPIILPIISPNKQTIIKKTEIDSNGNEKIIVNASSLINNILGGLNISNKSNNNNNKLVSEPINNNNNEIIALELKSKADSILNNKIKLNEKENNLFDQSNEFINNFEKYYNNTTSTIVNNKKKSKNNNNNNNNTESSDDTLKQQFSNNIEELLKIIDIDIELKNEFIIFSKAALRYSKVQKKFMSLKYIQISKKKIKELFKSINEFKEFLEKVYNNFKLIKILPSKEFVNKLISSLNYYIYKPLEIVYSVMIEAGDINAGILGFGHFAKFSMVALSTLGKLYSSIKLLQLNLDKSILNLTNIPLK